MLSQRAANEVVRDLLPEYQQEKERLDYIRMWHDWQPDAAMPLPKRATTEHAKLAEISRTPFLRIVTQSVSQCLHVDGWRSERTPDLLDTDLFPWRMWRANKMPRRQHAIHDAALIYGYSYGKTMPGELRGESMSSIRGVSPRRGYATWRDPAEDDHPEYFIEVLPTPEDHVKLIHLYDEDAVHYLQVKDTGETEYISHSLHESGVVPIVRYGMPDLDGHCVGRVEPFISTVSRINKTTYDRMLIQHFNSWRTRTIAGLELSDDSEETKMRVRHDDILVTDNPDATFGSLPETSMDGLIQALKHEEQTLAAVSQTPMDMFGSISNLSADAIAAARTGLVKTAFEWQQSFGEQHEQLLQLAALQSGREDDAYDETARVHWQDMEVRALSQAVDALGKAAQMLSVPVEALWSRIPDVDQDDVREWKRMIEENRQQALELDPLGQFAATLERHAEPTDEEQ